MNWVGTYLQVLYLKLLNTKRESLLSEKIMFIIRNVLWQSVNSLTVVTNHAKQEVKISIWVVTQLYSAKLYVSM